jgi:hypothetical protein
MIIESVRDGVKGQWIAGGVLYYYLKFYWTYFLKGSKINVL